MGGHNRPGPLQDLDSNKPDNASPSPNGKWDKDKGLTIGYQPNKNTLQNTVIPTLEGTPARIDIDPTHQMTNEDGRLPSNQIEAVREPLDAEVVPTEAKVPSHQNLN